MPDEPGLGLEWRPGLRSIPGDLAYRSLAPGLTGLRETLMEMYAIPEPLRQRWREIERGRSSVVSGPGLAVVPAVAGGDVPGEQHDHGIRPGNGPGPGTMANQAQADPDDQRGAVEARTAAVPYRFYGTSDPVLIADDDWVGLGSSWPIRYLTGQQVPWLAEGDTDRGDRHGTGCRDLLALRRPWR